METYTCGERQVPTRQEYQQYDRIWQRVSPELTPYPEIRSEQSSTSALMRLERLPGAVPDPCCMGTEAQQSLEVLRGFLDEECRQRQFYLAAQRRQTCPERAVLMGRLAEECLGSIRQLMAACYLITGRDIVPEVRSALPVSGEWRSLLRACYHQEACDRFNYTRAAEEAADLCVGELLHRLAERSQEQAELLFRELSRHMCRRRS